MKDRKREIVIMSVQILLCAVVCYLSVRPGGKIHAEKRGKDPGGADERADSPGKAAVSDKTRKNSEKKREIA